MITRLLQNPHLPFRVLAILTDDHDYWAQNHNTPHEVLENLAQSGDVWLREYVAENPSTPAHILDRLAHDTSPAVGEALIHNPNTPNSALRQLIQTDSYYLMLYAARHPNAQADTLEILSRVSRAISIQRSVYEHPNTPEHVRKALGAKPGVLEDKPLF